jgi:hypothetical protein
MIRKPPARSCSRQTSCNRVRNENRAILGMGDSTSPEERHVRRIIVRALRQLRLNEHGIPHTGLVLCELRLLKQIIDRAIRLLTKRQTNYPSLRDTRIFHADTSINSRKAEDIDKTEEDCG